MCSRIYGTGKSQKLNNLSDITIEVLKFRPIIAQNGTYTYNAAQVIGEYLKPLTDNNDYIIRNTQEFASMIKNQPPLRENEEYVSYDIVSLFTNIPIKETIDYIIDQVYNKKVIKEICNKLIFTRLLYKLTTESTFIFQSNYYKQIDGCTMGGPLSVILSDIFMTKLENDIVRPAKPEYYKRYVDDIICRRIKNEGDLLFQSLNQS